MSHANRQFRWWSPEVITYALVELQLWLAVLVGLGFLVGGVVSLCAGGGAPPAEGASGTSLPGWAIQIATGALMILMGLPIVFGRSRLWLQRWIAAPRVWMVIWLAAVVPLAIASTLEARKLRERLRSLQIREATIACTDGETGSPIPIHLQFADSSDRDARQGYTVRGDSQSQKTIQWIDWGPRVLEVSSPGYERKSITLEWSTPDPLVVPLARAPARR